MPPVSARISTTEIFWALISATELFSLRMRAHLAAGDSAAGYADFQDGFQTYRALGDQPTHLAGMLQMNALKEVCDAVGTGLRDHAWADQELRKLEVDFASVHIWKDYRRSLAGERGFANLYCDLLVDSPSKMRGDLLSSLGVTGRYAPVIPLSCLPRRVFRENQIRENQYFDELIAAASDDGTRFDPDSTVTLGTNHLTGIFDPSVFRGFNRFLPSSINWFIAQRTHCDEARVAIALERFRVARGAFPEKLTELVPDFIAELPMETYSRQPLIYRREDGGTFLLYGVGENRTDDGGVIDPNKGADEQRDDIWLYAPPPSK